VGYTRLGNKPLLAVLEEPKLVVGFWLQLRSLNQFSFSAGRIYIVKPIASALRDRNTARRVPKFLFFHVVEIGNDMQLRWDPGQLTRCLYLK
jgi:hypothetical protein